MSALPPKADIETQSRDVRFVPKADMTSRVECIFRQNSHLTKVVGAARGDQDAVTEVPRSSEIGPLTEHRRSSCHLISQRSFGSLS
jgi:hypothetical protein